VEKSTTFLSGPEMAPPDDELLRLSEHPTSAERLAARVWNKAGGLLSSLAAQLQLETGVAVAVFCVESGGDGFGPGGRMLIRFENHHFFRHWGKANSEVFHTHFQFDAKRPWTGHRWRASAAGEFELVHCGQAGEWRAFEFARSLDETAAKLSISMGSPQILGSNHAAAGFGSVHEMFDAFSSSERRQIEAFFDFLQKSEAQPRMVPALRQKDFRRFAELYNGPGNAAAYGEKIKQMYDTFERLRAARKPGGETILDVMEQLQDV